MVLREEGYSEVIRKEFGLNFRGKPKEIFLIDSTSKICVKYSNMAIMSIFTDSVIFEAIFARFEVKEPSSWRFTW